MKSKTIADYAEALWEVTKNVNKEKLADITAVFVKLLIKDNKINEAAKIIEKFEKLVQKNEGRYETEITTARKLTEEMRKNLQKSLGPQIEITEAVDPIILGGIIVKTEDIVLDGSLKTQLAKLKLALAK